MGKKKSKRKVTKQRKQAAGQMQVLGTDVGKLGTALVGAVAAEVAQVAITKIMESAQHDGRLSSMGDSVKDATATVKQAAVDSTPSVHGTIDIVKEVAEALRPSVAKVIDIVVNRVDEAKQAVETAAADSINTATQSTPHNPIQGIVEDLKPAMTNVIDVVSNRTADTKQTLEDTALDTIDAAKKALKKSKSGKKKSKKL